MVSLNESDKDFALMLQKSVQEALRGGDLVGLRDLYRKFPRKLRNYNRETGKVLKDAFALDFKNVKDPLIYNASTCSIVDLELEVDLSSGASMEKQTLQRVLDQIVFIIDSCWVCVIGETINTEIEVDGLLMQVVDVDFKLQMQGMLKLLQYYSFRVIPAITR